MHIGQLFKRKDQKSYKTIQKKLKFKYNRNKKNLGAAINFLKVAAMAKGDFIWFLGDDDLLVANAIEKLSSLIIKNKNCDFFWVNSYYLNAEYLKNFSTPFNTKHLPEKMIPHSPLKKNKKLKFFDLISPKISFDFLLGVYVCVFRKKKWEKNLHVIDKKLIKDTKTWSNFDNTCFFNKVFSEAFNNSKAYFCAKPLSVNLFGVREWGDL